MLSEQFRANSAYVGKMQGFLQDPVFVHAIVTLRDEALTMTIDADPDARPEASIRLLSFICGFNNAVNTLLELGEPLPPPPTEEQPWENVISRGE